jgi:uncharacterized membrane protein
MNKLKLACFGACIALCLAIFSGLINSQAIVKAEGQVSPPGEEKIELDCKYPEISQEAELSFYFSVGLSYKGGEQKKLFDFYTEGPPGWSVYVQSTSYGETPSIIPSMYLDPKATYPETMRVVAGKAPWDLPEPGEYTFKFRVAEASTGSPEASIELKAIVTGRSDFLVKTTSGRLDIKAKAGEDSYLPVTVINIGTTVLDKVTFSSSKPGDWSITFKPEKIESLSPDSSEEIEVAIKPPPKTIAGDYMVTLKFDSDPRPSVTELPELDIRVTVSTPSHWGWIGVGIVIAVIAGLAVTFTRLGRR